MFRFGGTVGCDAAAVADCAKAVGVVDGGSASASDDADAWRQWEFGPVH